jgi:hypothetical protein
VCGPAATLLLPTCQVLLSATMHTGLGGLAALSLHAPVSIGFSAELRGERLVLEGADGGAAARPAADEPRDAPEQFAIPKQLKQHCLEVLLEHGSHPRSAASSRSARPIEYTRSYLACRIGHLVPIW